MGTGQAQKDLILALKNRGETVFACSYISGDVAEQYVDCFSQINITDADAVYEFALENKVEYIYSVGSDMAMPTVFGVAERAGLPSFASEQVAKICNTKQLLRESLGADFKGNLQFVAAQTVDELMGMEFPLMIKPVDSQGQRGVFRVNNVDELKEKFSLSQGFSRSGKVIAEQFVEGDEISVNTFSINGEVVFNLISDRVVWDELPGGIIHKHLIPSVYETNEVAKNAICDLVDRVLKKMEIKNGPAYFQIKMKAVDDPKLIEVTPRLDGCHMWRLIKYATGVDLLEMSVDLLLGKKVECNQDYEIKTCRTEFLCLPPQSSFSKDQFDVTGADYLQWYYNDGDTVKSMNGFMEKCGYMITLE